MKIRIITHHAVYNHGAILQLYALSKILLKYDNTVCALNYSKNYDFLPEYAGVKYNISIKSIPFYLKLLRENGLGRTMFNINKRKKLNSFVSNNKLVGEYYSRAEDLDAVFIGSDEVFSIEPGLNPFFWGMGVPSKHVFAYAGCFGPTTIDFIKQKYAMEYIKAGISRFDKISVRDQNSQNIIEALTGDYKPEQVCDPVILYGYANEKKEFKRPISDKYLFVYSYDKNMNDENEWKHIKNYARSKGYKVITAGFYHKWCDKCINVDPIELLNWIAFAECVVTDTFHGTVMSLVMNTPFATKIRDNRNKLEFLLSEYGVLDREILDFSKLDNILSSDMSFNEINNIISMKQRQGLSYIEKCICLCE